MQAHTIIENITATMATLNNHGGGVLQAGRGNPGYRHWGPSLEMVDTFDKILWELERCGMSTPRRQFTDEFKQEAVGLLAGSGRPLRQIVRGLGIAPFDAAGLARRRRPGECGPLRRSKTQAAARIPTRI